MNSQSQPIKKIGGTNNDINSDPKDTHHCLSEQMGGSNDWANKERVSIYWHRSYNTDLELTYNGSIQPTRVLARYLILNTLDRGGVIDPMILREYLQELTPSRWQDSYVRDAVSDQALNWNYDVENNPNLHQIVRNFAGMITKERDMISSALEHVSTRNDPSRNGGPRMLAQMHRFFGTNNPNTVITQFINTTALSKAIKPELRDEIRKKARFKIVSRSKAVREKIIDVLQEHDPALDHAFRVWYPVAKQYDVAKQRIRHIPLRELNNREKRKFRKRNWKKED